MHVCTLRHQHHVVCYHCILWSTNRIMHSTWLVNVVMLLELKKFWHWVGMSTTLIVDGWVIMHTLHTSGCVGYQYTVLIDTTSVRSLWFTLDCYVDLSLAEAILQRHHQWNISYSYIPWELIYLFDVRYMPWACNQHINTLYSAWLL